MMTWALSVDLRERAVAAYLAGTGTQKAVASRFQFSQSTLSVWLKHKRERGTLEPSRPPGRERKLNAEDEAYLLQLLEVRSDLTLEELADGLRERDVEVSRFAVGRALHRMGWSRKVRRLPGGDLHRGVGASTPPAC